MQEEDKIEESSDSSEENGGLPQHEHVTTINDQDFIEGDPLIDLIA